MKCRTSNANRGREQIVGDETRQCNHVHLRCVIACVQGALEFFRKLARKALLMTLNERYILRLSPSPNAPSWALFRHAVTYENLSHLRVWYIAEHPHLCKLSQYKWIMFRSPYCTGRAADIGGLQQTVFNNINCRLTWPKLRSTGCFVAAITEDGTLWKYHVETTHARFEDRYTRRREYSEVGPYLQLPSAISSKPRCILNRVVITKSKRVVHSCTRRRTYMNTADHTAISSWHRHARPTSKAPTRVMPPYTFTVWRDLSGNSLLIATAPRKKLLSATPFDPPWPLFKTK